MNTRYYAHQKNKKRRRRQPLFHPRWLRQKGLRRPIRFRHSRRGLRSPASPLLPIVLVLLAACILALILRISGVSPAHAPATDGPLNLQTTFAAEASPIVSIAASRLGDPCFQPASDEGPYTDCSLLVQWSMEQLGVSLPRTAAEQAAFCAENLLTVPFSELQSGDLIFWSFEQNGRYKDISHTGIYAGNSCIIDASYSEGRVVYRPLYSPEKIVLCARISPKPLPEKKLHAVFSLRTTAPLESSH